MSVVFWRHTTLSALVSYHVLIPRTLIQGGCQVDDGLPVVVGDEFSVSVFGKFKDVAFLSSTTKLLVDVPDTPRIVQNWYFSF
jgi:hypothetical protein